jgi:hypothetical protein
MELMQHQLDAIELLGSGKILWGGVGVGKSATVLGYYMKAEQPRDIYVITTAKKRDSLDWEKEAVGFGIGPELSVAGLITVDSWNNVKKYIGIKDAFFIFDEQRLVSNGSWVKSFIKIARENHWVLLTATPGDTWLDYAPVFIANGFYRNITNFKFEHILYEPWTKYPRIRMYLKEKKLEFLRNDVLVEMPYFSHTERYLNYLPVKYDKGLYKIVFKNRWNPWENRPIKDASELFRLMRRVANSDPSRLETVRELMKTHPKLIIFYNFNYELAILRTLKDEISVFEWNGHKKDPPPEGNGGDKWVYLVQYIAGSEAWNCISTDAMVLYSLTYSYKNFVQAQGRIDRLNTPFSSLFYYILASDLKIDFEIKKSLQNKKNFNEKKWIKKDENLELFFE